MFAEEESELSDDEMIVTVGMTSSSPLGWVLCSKLRICSTFAIVSTGLKQESDSESTSGTDSIGTTFSPDATTGLWAEEIFDTVGYPGLADGAEALSAEGIERVVVFADSLYDEKSTDWSDVFVGEAE